MATPSRLNVGRGSGVETIWPLRSAYISERWRRHWKRWKASEPSRLNP
jgi:hypothetical protein